MATKHDQLPEMFCKKSAFKNFAKFTGKHQRQSLFPNKVAGLNISGRLGIFTV